TAKFDLILNVQEVPAGLLCSVEYNVDLFEASTMARLLEHWQGLLQAMVTHPEQGVLDLPLLTEAERQLLLGQWNATARQEPACPLLIHEGIEQQVQRTPEALALVAEQGALTYDELNRRANQLAHYLRQRGVGSGSLVGVCLERSLEMVIGLLAILKAGGAYLPLDPDYPSQRLLHMVRQSQLSILLTQDCFREKFCEYNESILYIDNSWQDTLQMDITDPVRDVGSPQLAYVIYTSGSTGQPKGAGTYHQGEVNLLHWFIKEGTITAQDRFLLVSSLGFDLSQKNIFAPLSVGATLSLLPSGAYDPAIIVQTIAQQQISLLNCTPSAFYPLLEHPAGAAALGSLRLLFLGGEPISLARLHAWMTSPSFHTQIINTYGPTECTDIALFYRLPPPEQAAETIPLGKPLRNVQVLVLDERLHLVPVGMAGELCILGAGVGPGYLNDPALTAAKFLPNPFSELAGSRLYKTGDRARYLPSGDLEFLGRFDAQVKLRGVRLELGEIETVLAQHPAVQEAVVLLREETATGPALIAYFVLAAQAVFSHKALRSYLKERLPAHMVPSLFVPLDILPLNAHGKVDRKSLPVPETRWV